LLFSSISDRIWSEQGCVFCSLHAVPEAATSEAALFCPALCLAIAENCIPVLWQIIALPMPLCALPLHRQASPLLIVAPQFHALPLPCSAVPPLHFSPPWHLLDQLCPCDTVPRLSAAFHALPQLFKA